MRRVFDVGSWILALDILRVFAWTKICVLATMKLIKVQSWMRIHGLPLKYWQSKVIFSIAREISNPLVLDDSTIKKSRGFLARVIIDINMIYDLPN